MKNIATLQAQLGEKEAKLGEVRDQLKQSGAAISDSISHERLREL